MSFSRPEFSRAGVVITLIAMLGAGACADSSDTYSPGALTAEQSGIEHFAPVNGACVTWAKPSDVLGDEIDSLGRTTFTIARDTAAAMQLSTFKELQVDEDLVGTKAANQLRHVGDMQAASSNANAHEDQGDCAAYTGVSVGFSLEDSCTVDGVLRSTQFRGQQTRVSYRLEPDGSLILQGAVVEDLSRDFSNAVNTVEQNREECAQELGGVLTTAIKVDGIYRAA